MTAAEAVQPAPEPVAETITLIVNGRPETHPAGTSLATVVALASPAPSGIAAAVGDDVIPRAEWAAHTLNDGDDVEILTAVQGG